MFETGSPRVVTLPRSMKELFQKKKDLTNADETGRHRGICQRSTSMLLFLTNVRSWCGSSAETLRLLCDYFQHELTSRRSGEDPAPLAESQPHRRPRGSSAVAISQTASAFTSGASWVLSAAAQCDLRELCCQQRDSSGPIRLLTCK